MRNEKRRLSKMNLSHSDGLYRFSAVFRHSNPFIVHVDVGLIVCCMMKVCPENVDLELHQQGVSAIDPRTKARRTTRE